MDRTARIGNTVDVKVADSMNSLQAAVAFVMIAAFLGAMSLPIQGLFHKSASTTWAAAVCAFALAFLTGGAITAALFIASCVELGLACAFARSANGHDTLRSILWFVAAALLVLIISKLGALLVAFVLALLVFGAGTWLVFDHRQPFPPAIP